MGQARVISAVISRHRPSTTAVPLHRLPSRLLIAAALCVAGPWTHAAELTVSAAASLTNAFRELVPLFEAQEPGTKVLLNFGASGALLQQIAKGAPVDVFASADQETMDQAQAQGLLKPAQRRDFVSNTLVLIVPAGATLVPRQLSDLKDTGYARVAMGLPASVPVGRYTRDVLEKAGLWPAIGPRMIGAQNVRQALDYVARGEVNAGFVYATDAASMPGKVRVAFTVPTNAPVRYPIAALADAPQPELAQKFTAFVQTPASRAVLTRHGFGKP